MNICIGGTFNIFHKGHEFLINKAIEKTDKDGYLLIGITNGKMTQRKKNIKPFEERKKSIINYLSKKDFKCKIEIIKIKDKFGPSIKGDFDGIIVSPETRKTAEEINKERKKIDKKKLEIFEIPFVLAYDNKPISSTRISKSEINKKGHILKKD